MSLREFLARWLRGLRATAVNLDEALMGRRPRSLADELARDIAELRALQSAHSLTPVPLTVSLEALWERPTVTPDRSKHLRPDFESVNAVMTWMVYERSAAWWGVPGAKVRDAAVYWLAMRERVTGVRLP